MRKKNLTLGVIAAAALIAPLGFTTPAIAAPTNEGSSLDVPAVEAPVDAGAQAAELLAPIDAPEGGEAQAVKAAFGGLSVNNPGSITPPSGTSAKKKRFNVRFDGPVNSSRYTYQMADASYYGPKVTPYKVNKKLKSSYINKPYVDGPGTAISPAKTTNATVSAYKYTTPGKYKVRVPVTQRDYAYSPARVATRSVNKYVTVRSNTKTSKSLTSLSGSARAKKTFPLTVNAPAYHAGSKVTVYYKATGQKKYKKVATGKLKSNNSTFSKTKINISKKYNVGGKGGRIYVKVGSATYAKSYKSSAGKLKKRYY